MIGSRTRLLAFTLGAGLLASACSSGGSGATSASVDGGEPTGEITVLTNRTDLVKDGTFDGYAAEFKKLYPDVTVTFEGVTDYEGEVKVRMNTDKYGDVLLIPNSISPADYPTFFSSLGSLDTMSQSYRYVANAAVDGEVYGLAQNGNAVGYVYNKPLWEKAGINQAPTTPSEFLADLDKLKTLGVTPLYTNYKDGWPLAKWTDTLGTVSCDGNAKNGLATTDEPWTADSDLGVGDTLLFDAVQQGLTEDDPTTTNWENSKTLLGSGEVGAMWLGSWAVLQMQDAATKAGGQASDIGFRPFPTQVDGTFCAQNQPDYLQAVNKHSEHQAAAQAWITWFTEESGFSAAQGSIPTRLDGELPATLQEFSDLDVTLVELAPAPADQVGLVDEIDKTSEVGLYAPDYRRALIDVARGAAPGTLDSIFDDLNAKWAAARAISG
ncbi:MAG: extracellular solute-binding protein [Phycicoccus sp.]|nr:extracellular solute-binding protein [Phycicoccus sp.]